MIAINVCLFAIVLPFVAAFAVATFAIVKAELRARRVRRMLERDLAAADEARRQRSES